MDEWNIGDPDWWGDGFTRAENYGSNRNENENETPPNYQIKAINLKRKGLYSEALEAINQALDSRKTSENWNIKGIILNNLAFDDPSLYREAIDCYNQSLSLRDSIIVKNNKAICLSNWAWHLQENRYYELAYGKLREAFPLFEKKDIDYAYALDVAGVIFHKTNRPERARAMYDEALLYDPENEIYKDNIKRLSEGLDVDYEYLKKNKVRL